MKPLKIKFKPRRQGKLHFPVFIVGINPGRPSKNQRQFFTWTGPRGASLVCQVTHDLINCYFTNVFNWYVYPKTEVNQFLIDEGIKKLKRDLRKYQPIKVICFGKYTYNVVQSLSLYETTVVKFPHPSFVYRFKPRERQEFIQKLRKEVK